MASRKKTKQQNYTASTNKEKKKADKKVNTRTKTVGKTKTNEH